MYLEMGVAGECFSKSVDKSENRAETSSKCWRWLEELNMQVPWKLDGSM